jgi:hypothetical protein
MLAAVLTLRQLARQVWGNVKCNFGSTVAGATRHVTGASGTSLDGGIRFPGELSITTGAFAPGQVLNFGSLAYIADNHSELRLLHRAASVGNEPPASPPPPGLLGADLEVLAHQIRHALGENPIVLERRQIFYMLSNIHHEIIADEMLPPLDHF